MLKIQRICVYLFLCVLFFSLAVADQTGYRTKNEFEEARFAIDAVDFKSSHQDVNRVEVYYKIFYDALSYKKTKDGYQADYQVSIVIEGDDDAQIAAEIKTGTIKLKTYAETRRAHDFLVNMISATYGPQNLKVRAILADADGNTLAEVERRLKKRKYREKYPTLSRVEFADKIVPATRKSKFNKGDRKVIPRVNRLYGGEQDSLLSYYFEIYPGKVKDKYTKIVTNLFLRNRGLKYTDTVDIGEISHMIRQFRQIDVKDMHPGDYEMELSVIGRRGKVYHKYSEPFELELTAESIFKSDYKLAVSMLKYLTSSGEQKKLKKAKTSEERRKAWDEFWAARKVEGISPTNPSKLEYFRRIRHANRYFSLLNKDGWKTTRGMVYIKYGMPDEVEDHPFELDVKPYQVWLYYRLNPSRRFVFVDEWGDGNYELQPPYDGIGF